MPPSHKKIKRIKVISKNLISMTWLNSPQSKWGLWYNILMKWYVRQNFSKTRLNMITFIWCHCYKFWFFCFLAILASWILNLFKMFWCPDNINQSTGLEYVHFHFFFLWVLIVEINSYCFTQQYPIVLHFDLPAVNISLKKSIHATSVLGG